MYFKILYCLPLLVFSTLSYAQQNASPKAISDDKMIVEVWSDMVCPFCYIGKRKFEAALAQFSHKDNIEIIWKSFQLSPDMKTSPDKNAIQSLAEEKGISLERASAMTINVTQWAREVGLDYHFDKSIAANTFHAHRFMQLAKQYGKAGEAEEVVFRSFFTDGKNIDDYSTLVQLGYEIGLDTTVVRESLHNGSYAESVQKDLAEARRLGIHGVPHFQFNGKQTVSGAQEPKVFLKVLESAWEDWEKNKKERK